MSTGEKKPERGLCAYAKCEAESTKRCSRCKVVFYCSRDCQTKHWPTHKRDCTLFTSVPAKPDLNEQEEVVKLHHREFRRIIHQYGLDKGKKADLLADFLTNKSENESISPEQLAERFSIPKDDASTLLSWVNVALRFKEENLDGNAAPSV
eukprot:m.22079 g.22079  ORF g.22079 m.22079 type:complete len:151 (-) comp9235_c0_seq1:28-480(-)